VCTGCQAGKRRHFEPENCTFFSGRGNENHHLKTRSFVHHRTVSAVTRVELVSDEMSNIILRGCWYNIIVLNVHAPSKEKSYDSKDSFYRKFERGFDHFNKYYIQIL
jgi:hypothetical protein